MLLLVIVILSVFELAYSLASQIAIWSAESLFAKFKKYFSISLSMLNLASLITILTMIAVMHRTDEWIEYWTLGYCVIRTAMEWSYFVHLISISKNYAMVLILPSIFSVIIMFLVCFTPKSSEMSKEWLLTISIISIIKMLIGSVFIIKEKMAEQPCEGLLDDYKNEARAQIVMDMINEL